jgi:two-component system, OmpR family, response regulator VanR
MGGGSDGNVSNREVILSSNPRLTYSYQTKRLMQDTVQVPLANLEIILLELLLKNTDKIVTYSQIENLVYDWPPTRNAISSLVKKLRAKLGDTKIENLQGNGYWLCLL